MIESKSVRIAKMALLTALSTAPIVLGVRADAAPRATTAAPSTRTEEVDPRAKEALKRMTDYLKTLQAFTVRAAASKDEVVGNEFKVDKESEVTLNVRKPDRLRAEVLGDNGDKVFVYDGKSLVVFTQPEKYYATMPAPPTIKETLDAALKQHGIELPLADFIYTAMGDDLGSSALAAGDIGPSRVAGSDCEHYAFRSTKVDWQIWIEQGERPLPRKFVITTRDAPGRPEYAAVLTWDVSPHFDDATFTFSPPEGAKPIEFAPQGGAIGGGPKSTKPQPKK
jgi:hypothetical protein